MSQAPSRQRPAVAGMKAAVALQCRRATAQLSARLALGVSLCLLSLPQGVLAQEAPKVLGWQASTAQGDAAAGLPAPLVSRRDDARRRSQGSLQAELDFRQAGEDWLFEAMQQADYAEIEGRFQKLLHAGRTPSGRQVDFWLWPNLLAWAGARPDCESGRLLAGQVLAAACGKPPSALAHGGPGTRQALLKEWRARQPDSPVPDMLEAHWWRAHAWVRRGEKLASETPDADYLAFKQALVKAQDHVDAAGRLDGAAWPAWWSLRLLQAMEGPGDLQDVLQTWHDAQSRFQAHPDHIHEVLRALQPRWLGSLALMARFTEEVEREVGPVAGLASVAVAYRRWYEIEGEAFRRVPVLHDQRLAAEQARNRLYPTATTRASWLRAACDARQTAQAVEAARGLDAQSHWGLAFDSEASSRTCHLLLLPVLRDKTPPWQPPNAS